MTLSVRMQDENSAYSETPGGDAWQTWIREYGPRLLLFARQQTRTEADSEDVLQIALVESWERTGRNEPPPLPLVFATIRRRAIDWARSNDRRAAREQAELPGDVPWFDPSLADAELREELEAAMKKLPQMYREVITLKVWGELTFEQIAEVLDIPLNTAASRYRYGLDGLRKQMSRLTV